MAYTSFRQSISVSVTVNGHSDIGSLRSYDSKLLVSEFKKISKLCLFICEPRVTTPLANDEGKLREKSCTPDEALKHVLSQQH